MTDAELEELGALLARSGLAPVMELYAQTEGAEGYVVSGAHDQPLFSVYGAEVERVDAVIKALNSLPSLISAIRELREENAQTKLGYDADIKALCEALWKREPGCEFVRLNYPQIAAELVEEQS